MDLIGRLALANLEIEDQVCKNEKDRLDLNSFRLIFYASFRRKSVAVGLDLMENLADFCLENQPTH